MKNIILHSTIVVLLLIHNVLQGQVIEHDFGDERISDVIMSDDDVKFVTFITHSPDSLIGYIHNKIIFTSGKVIDFGTQEGIISANENTVYTGIRKKGEEEAFFCEYSVGKNSLSLKKKVKFPENMWRLLSMQNSKGDFLEHEVDENYSYGIDFYSSDLKLLSTYQPYIAYEAYQFEFNEQFMLMKVQNSNSKNKSKLALFNKETLEKKAEIEIILDEGFYSVSSFLNDANIYITSASYQNSQHKYLLQAYDFDMNCVWETEKISRPHRKLYFDYNSEYMYSAGCPIEKINKENGEISQIEFPDYCEITNKKKNETTFICDLFVTQTGDIRVLIATSERGVHETSVKDLQLFFFDKNSDCVNYIDIQKGEIGIESWPYFIQDKSNECRIVFNSKIIKI